MADILRVRIFAIACGYEDANDFNRLRTDPRRRHRPPGRDDTSSWQDPTGKEIRGPLRRLPEIMISQRPAEAADHAVPGHWEGDLILGLGSSGSSAHEEWPCSRGTRGGRSRARRITRTIITLPEELRRSLTWDQGAEVAQHDRL